MRIAKYQKKPHREPCTRIKPPMTDSKCYKKSNAALGTGVGELSEEYNKVRVQNKKSRGVGWGRKGIQYMCLRKVLTSINSAATSTPVQADR
jgi:hypothetical protein